MHVKSSAWADENKLKGEKASFLSEVSEINSRCVIFNLFEWTLFKNVSMYGSCHLTCLPFFKTSLHLNLSRLHSFFIRLFFISSHIPSNNVLPGLHFFSQVGFTYIAILGILFSSILLTYQMSCFLCISSSAVSLIFIFYV